MALPRALVPTENHCAVRRCRMNPADIFLAAWAVFWGAMFASIAGRQPGWFDIYGLMALLALVVFPVLCVHVDRLAR